ncbi:MAG: sigma 54-interacting transcriptional regulator, partial [Firmicutes bacterium]|nr:sigma 54-interacting transcriptional regulator [Bacillota bacterium]
MKNDHSMMPAEILKEVFDHSDITVFITSESGELIYKNRDSADLLFDSGWSSYTSPSNKERLDRKFVYRNSATNVKLIQTEKGNFYLYLFADDAEKKMIINENRTLRDIIDHVDNGVILSDKDGYIRLYNKAHEEIDGYTREYVIGKHLSELYRVENHTKVQAEKKAIDMRFHHYATMEREHIPLVTGTYPYIDPATNEVFGVYSVERDISAIRELQQKVASMEQQLSQKTRKNNTRFTFEDIMGNSKSIKDTITHARRFADSSTPVMICGETGTGKELFAQSIHNASVRSESPFIAINCGAIPENLIESTLFGSVKGAFTGAENQNGLFLEAKDGTLFLDEVNSMSIAMQTKLLRVLQEMKVRPVGSSKEHAIQCRILSSCNVDPEEALREKTFRSDLYYRLAVVRIDIPPLRHRENDSVELAKYFAQKYA